MAHRRRNEDVDARDRLEGQSAHLKMCLAQCRLHGVDDLTREEGCNDRRLCVPAALSDERLEFVAVELVADRAVADAVVARRIIDRMRVREFSLRSLNAGKVEIALLRGCNCARDVLFRVGSHRVERTSCRSDGGTAQCACALGEATFDLTDDGSDLRYIVNLTVEHGTRFVLQPLCGEDVELPVTLLSNDADDAARTDVQRKDELRGTFTAHRRRADRCLTFFWTTASFCRSVLRLLLHAFLWTAAFFCGCVLGSRFVRFIQIRHVDLP